jgi:hypothetical protein
MPAVAHGIDIRVRRRELQARVDALGFALILE